MEEGEPVSPLTWIGRASGETLVDCHTRPSFQCAGLAIFRANICKLPRYSMILTLPPDPVNVFKTRQEFINHHIAPIYANDK
jgi:hypothetical protein